MPTSDSNAAMGELLLLMIKNRTTTKMIKIGVTTKIPRYSVSILFSIKTINHILTYCFLVKMSILLAVMAVPSFVMAAEEVMRRPIPFQKCFEEAARRYSVEPSLLMALAYTESRFNAVAVNERSATDKDIGIMQIWSNWLPKLEKYNIREKDLLNPCVNINVGAWILAQNFASHGVSLKSLGAYNAGFKDGNESKRIAYVEKVLPKLYHYRNILNERNENE
jgi:soluble lytic murein transglycosylase-like protein